MRIVAATTAIAGNKAQSSSERAPVPAAFSTVRVLASSTLPATSTAWNSTECLPEPRKGLYDADGIGDTPYETDSGGVDRYPWMTTDMVYIPEFGRALIPALLVICVLPVVLSRLRRARVT